MCSLRVHASAAFTSQSPRSLDSSSSSSLQPAPPLPAARCPSLSEGGYCFLPNPWHCLGLCLQLATAQPFTWPTSLSLSPQPSSLCDSLPSAQTMEVVPRSLCTRRPWLRGRHWPTDSCLLTMSSSGREKEFLFSKDSDPIF